MDDREVAVDILVEGLVWSRCCEVTTRVYRLISAWSDRVFADRILSNTLGIPERLAARMASADERTRADHARATVEALTILQTQLYLASECGLVDRRESAGLCYEAAALVERLVGQHRLMQRDAGDKP